MATVSEAKPVNKVVAVAGERWGNQCEALTVVTYYHS